jgi:hypothetical protein
MTMRFEAFEQGRIIDIQDQEVISEYLKEGNNEANGPGLVMLDSLNKWRHEGWPAAGQHYDIHVYTSINWKNHSEVMAAVYLLNGVYCGLFLPISAQAQVGQLWEVTGNPDGIVGSWGGHCVYVMAYNEVGPICMTWGKRQQMSWYFWDTYCEEAYVVLDSSDKWVTNSPVDHDKLESTLAEITGTPIPIKSPDPWYIRLMQWIESLFIGGSMKNWFLTHKLAILNILMILVALVPNLPIDPTWKATVIGVVNLIIDQLRKPVAALQARMKAARMAKAQ